MLFRTWKDWGHAWRLGPELAQQRSELYKSIYGTSYHRAAAFDITGRKTTETPSVILRFSHKTAWQEAAISTVILETQAARNLRSTTVSTVAVAQLPCRLDRAAT